MRIPLACMRGHRGGKGCMCWRFTPRVLMLVRDLLKGWEAAECWCDLTNEVLIWVRITFGRRVGF
jgi:hypothetical protein